MRDPSFYVSGLLDLHNIADAAERRATWRQSMATLARVSAEEGPGPLDGLHPDALVRGVRAAIANGLVDDLDWLAPAAAGAALYELASALPVGLEQRDLGRRVLARLLAGNVEVFVTLANRMAWGAGKGLTTPALRARMALVTELPIGLGVADGPLALALSSRRELVREWIIHPSTGSLPARRLAARLLERAAREAARRAARGDEHALRIFAGEAISATFRRLLEDRESLVWRHLAVARGLLAGHVPEHRQAIETSLDPSLSPTEWRRAAAAVSAYAALAPEQALRLASQAIGMGLVKKDPGVASAFVWGLARAAETEPDAASDMLDLLLDVAPREAAEALNELRAEFGHAAFIDRVTPKAIDALLRGTQQGTDDGEVALAREIARDLERAPRADQPLREQLAAALGVFFNDGARAAYSAARDVLQATTGAMDALLAVAREDDEAEGRAGSLARRTTLAVLRDLELSVLEHNILGDLLRLGTSPDHVKTHDEALDDVREHLSEWILAREGAPLASGGFAGGLPRESAGPMAVKPAHPALRLRRLRALLHLVDSDVGDNHDDSARAARLRRRWLRIAKALMARFERDPPSVLRRTILAALARALDALVRVGVCDVADVFLVLSRHMSDPAEFETLAEASMDPDLIQALARYAHFVRTCRNTPALSAGPTQDSLFPPAALEAEPPLRRGLVAFGELARELMPDASSRTEALRSVLMRLDASLTAVASAPSLRMLSSTGNNEPDAIAALETALGALVQLATGARGRLDPDRISIVPLSVGNSRAFTVAISRVLSGGGPLSEHVVAACVDELLAGIPAAIAQLASSVMWGLIELPLDRPSLESAPVRAAEQQLPAWLSARRTIGGFYVVRALGAGAVGSVFVVNRVEDRHEPQAERFALKVPDYSATAARSISESEFMALFRSEASALMALPSHPNLARFVTFDLAARPKPILVMELVEGQTLERVLETATFEARKVATVLDGVLSGLEAMHGVGVGHLDLKPSNVVLRGGDQPVLVDFGLAGRHMRPGCATGPYGAPEVWGVIPPGYKPAPMAVDIYAFGCMAFEAFTGQMLFDAESEVALITLHISHDGFPAKLRALAARPEYASLAELLFGALRRDPRNRPDVATLRAGLRKLGPELARRRWPFRAAEGG